MPSPFQDRVDAVERLGDIRAVTRTHEPFRAHGDQFPSSTQSQGAVLSQRKAEVSKVLKHIDAGFVCRPLVAARAHCIGSDPLDEQSGSASLKIGMR